MSAVPNRRRAARPTANRRGAARATPGRMASSPSIVIKVGGSLSVRPRALRRLMTTLGALARGRTLVVVPGGGSFADEVRRADRRFALADSAAHWMAILAMDQYAYLLAHLAGDRGGGRWCPARAGGRGFPAGTGGALIVHGPGEIEAGRLNVLAPAAWIGRADPLPHSWDVTSDSIAAWVARRLHAQTLVLLKDVDGVFDGDPRRRRRIRPAPRAGRDGLDGIVDSYFRQALVQRMPCWIVNGTHPERVRALLETGHTYGTEVV
jgi:5-(aminomethyl)-3-furanmethanol phosphate kinase